MRKSGIRLFAVPLIVIPIVGLLLMAVTWLFYALVYNLLETLFFPNDPFSFPADALRRVYAMALVLLYLLLLRTQILDLLKAILLTMPLSTVIITVGHSLYQQPPVSISAMFGTIAICGLLLYRFKKPWIYYYAGAVASLFALAYAWPRPPE